jgi:hypothetical protein
LTILLPRHDERQDTIPLSCNKSELYKHLICWTQAAQARSGPHNMRISAVTYMRGAGSGTGCLSRTHELTNRPFRPVVAELCFANSTEKERDQNRHAKMKYYINNANKAIGRKCGQLKRKVLKANFHITVSHVCDVFFTLKGECKFKCSKTKCSGARRMKLVGNLG